MQSTKPHAALLASPGMGHLIPFLELGKSLVTHHGFNATIFVLEANSSTKQTQLVKSPNPDQLNIVSLPAVDVSGLIDPAAPLPAKILVMMHESLPLLRSAILAMKFRPTVLIVDLFGTEALAVADELAMLKYVFMTTNAWFVALVIYAPNLDKKEKDGHVFHHQPLKIPGCKPLRFEDTIDVFLDQTDQAYAEFSRVGIEMSTADGILVNTWEDLEPTTLKAMTNSEIFGRFAKLQVFPIGPLVRSVEPPVLENHVKVLDWLDMQPTKSVIYVSFGSGGTLSGQQLTELAWGLELSQQRFIWVLRPPIEDDASATYLNIGNGIDNSPDYLPDGFMTRTHNMGVVVPMWAPQTEILSHASVGGFLSHCGWNSTLESIVNGVPMIAWPLYSEQKMNATMLTEELGVAVPLKATTLNGVVGREEIKMMVRRILVDKEGHAIRNRVKELKHGAQKALGKGGSSYSSLSRMAKDCEISLKGKAQGA